MKNFVKIIIVITILMTIIMAIFSMTQINRVINIAEKALTGHEKDERTAVARVVDLQNDVVTFKTSDGLLYEWEVEPGETFEMRSCYRVTFDTLGTSSLLDDVIINIERD